MGKNRKCRRADIFGAGVPPCFCVCRGGKGVMGGARVWRGNIGLTRLREKASLRWAGHLPGKCGFGGFTERHGGGTDQDLEEGFGEGAGDGEGASGESS